MVAPPRAVPTDTWLRPASKSSLPNRCRLLALLAILFLSALTISSITVFSAHSPDEQVHTQLKRQFQLSGFLGSHIDEVSLVSKTRYSLLTSER